jgi:hypothetical protein
MEQSGYTYQGIIADDSRVTFIKSLKGKLQLCLDDFPFTRYLLKIHRPNGIGLIKGGVDHKQISRKIRILYGKFSSSRLRSFTKFELTSMSAHKSRIYS